MLISPNLSAILYLVSSVLFILALKGLSSPNSAKSGNILGITGMMIAVLTTLLSLKSGSSLVIIGIIIGGLIGVFIALKIQMVQPLYGVDSSK